MKKKTDKSAVAARTDPADPEQTDPAPPERDPTEGPDAMSADERAMFDTIMGEIGGQEAAPADGTGSTSPASDDATPRDTADDDLDDDQRKAFESIMAQIEGGAGDDAAPAGDGDPAGSDDDAFAAELEKVAAAADTPPETAEEDPEADDDLDEDQRKAFESIMAQIEGGAGDDAAPAGGGDPAGSDDDAFAAELEKIAAAADTPPETAEEDPEADGDLDEDQRKALESIMTAIENEKGPLSAPGDADEAPGPIASARSATTAATAVDSSAGEDGAAPTGEDGDSDEIEDILNEIALSDEGASESPVSAPTDHEDLPSGDPVDDDIVVHRKAEDAPEGRVPASTAVEGRSASDAGQATPAASGGGRRRPIRQNDAAAEGLPLADQAAAPLKPLAGKTPARWWIGVTASLLLVVCAALAGYHFRLPGQSPQVPPVPAAPDRAAGDEPPAPVPPSPPAAHQEAGSDPSRLRSIGDDLDRLRSELIAKQAEIEDLRGYYQAGIDAEIQSLVGLLTPATGKAATYAEAAADPRIQLALAAIQRRATYVRKLEKPVHSLTRNGEELLYQSRRAGLLAMMAGKTSDVDVEAFQREAETVMTAHRQALAGLNIDTVQVPIPSLESIWQQVASRLAAGPGPAASSRPTGERDDAAIWKAVCDGDFSRKDQLRLLSPEAARCLAKWKGKDLFLNELTDLSPEAARQLVAWEGDWLGLNGLTELSPELAVHLSHWKGKGLSLNGLTRLSPRVVAILSEWQGDQIELVNLKHMAHWENPKTRLYLSEAMKRKQVPKR